MRATFIGLVLALLLLSSAGAFAAAPPARETQEPEPAAPPTAGQIKDAAKGAEARENAASKSIEDMLSKTGAPAQGGQPLQPVSGGQGSRSSGRKTIYGDIIIHK